MMCHFNLSTTALKTPLFNRSGVSFYVVDSFPHNRHLKKQVPSSAMPTKTASCSQSSGSGSGSGFSSILPKAKGFSEGFGALDGVGDHARFTPLRIALMHASVTPSRRESAACVPRLVGADLISATCSSVSLLWWFLLPRVSRLESIARHPGAVLCLPLETISFMLSERDPMKICDGRTHSLLSHLWHASFPFGGRDSNRNQCAGMFRPPSQNCP